MATICGNCGRTHAGVKEVKACYSASEQERKPRSGRKSNGNTSTAETGSAATVAERGVVRSFPERGVGPGRKQASKEGIYQDAEGVFWKVKISRTTLLPYAMIAVKQGDGPDAKTEFQYKPGAIRYITEDMYVGDRLPRAKKGKGKQSEASNVWPDDPESGMYRLRGPDGAEEILKVYKAVHGSGKMCAKRLIIEEPPVRDDEDKIIKPAVIGWKYLGLATRFLSAHVKVSLGEAAEWGAIYGCCMRCGATLTLEQSIEAGLGTTCIKYFQNVA